MMVQKQKMLDKEKLVVMLEGLARRLELVECKVLDGR